jgi:hypothetical protein
MRYVFATPGANRRVLHIQRHTATGEVLYAALCGIRLPFNRSINAPWGLGRPVCKRCRKAASNPEASA